MKRFATSLYILLALLMAPLMVGHGHVMAMGHSARHMDMGESCKLFCLSASSSDHQVEATLPVLAHSFGLLLGMIGVLMLYVRVAAQVSVMVFTHDPAPPGILAITQRLRF